MGIFRRFKRSRNDVFAPVCVVREEVKEISSKKVGSPNVRIVSLVETPIENYVVELPSVKEYDLEEMLKAGVDPRQIDVHGMLQSTSTFDVEGNFDKIVDAVNKSSVKDDVSSESNV